MGKACSIHGSNLYKVLEGKPEGKRPLGGLGTDGRIILKWILKKQDRRMWTGLIWLRIGTSGMLL
jgi:hypothetical protein